MPRDMSWRRAIDKVLSESSEALHYKELAERIIADDLRRNIGRTPANTVNGYLNAAIRNEGDDCPFKRVDKGLYIWKKR